MYLRVVYLVLAFQKFHRSFLSELPVKRFPALAKLLSHCWVFTKHDEVMTHMQGLFDSCSIHSKLYRASRKPSDQKGLSYIMLLLPQTRAL